MQKNSLTVGTYFLKELEKLKKKYSIIGDVRGKGLMIGVELVENDKLATPLDNEKFFVILEAFRKHGVIIGRGGLSGNVSSFKFLFLFASVFFLRFCGLNHLCVLPKKM